MPKHAESIKNDILTRGWDVTSELVGMVDDPLVMSKIEESLSRDAENFERTLKDLLFDQNTSIQTLSGDHRQGALRLVELMPQPHCSKAPENVTVRILSLLDKSVWKFLSIQFNRGAALQLPHMCIDRIQHISDIIEETKLALSSEKITQIQAFKAYCVRYGKDAGKKSRFAIYFVADELFPISIKQLISQYCQDLGQDILSQKIVEKTSQALQDTSNKISDREAFLKCVVNCLRNYTITHESTLSSTNYPTILRYLINHQLLHKNFVREIGDREMSAIATKFFDSHLFNFDWSSVGSISEALNAKLSENLKSIKGFLTPKLQTLADAILERITSVDIIEKKSSAVKAASSDLGVPIKFFSISKRGFSSPDCEVIFPPEHSGTQLASKSTDAPAESTDFIDENSSFEVELPNQDLERQFALLETHKVRSPPPIHKPPRNKWFYTFWKGNKWTSGV